MTIETLDFRDVRVRAEETVRQQRASFTGSSTSIGRRSRRYRTPSVSEEPRRAASQLQGLAP